jgi:hypothetical protein
MRYPIIFRNSSASFRNPDGEERWRMNEGELSDRQDPDRHDPDPLKKVQQYTTPTTDGRPNHSEVVHKQAYANEKTRLDTTRHDSTRHDKARQDKARQDRTGQDRTN